MILSLKDEHVSEGRAAGLNKQRDTPLRMIYAQIAAEHRLFQTHNLIIRVLLEFDPYSKQRKYTQHLIEIKSSLPDRCFITILSK